jgi:GNAT superfamily N-acetyltransferase
MLDPSIKLRRATPSDPAAHLVFEAAPFEYTVLAGSRARALRALERAWPQRGHSASYEFAWIAVIGDTPVGCVLAYPARRRIRLHAALLRRAIHLIPVVRLPLLLGALAHLSKATPAPPKDALYIGSLAIVARYRRRGIASALGEAVQRHAHEQGFGSVAAHTGFAHGIARRALEYNGATATNAHTNGYALYVKVLDNP